MLAGAPLELECLDVAWRGERGTLLARCAGAAAASAHPARRRAHRRPQGSGVSRSSPTTRHCGQDSAPPSAPGRARSCASGPLPSALPAIVGAVRACGGTLVGRAGLGTSYVAVDPGAITRLRAALPSGAVSVILDAPEDARAALSPWGPAEGPSLRLMEQVKARFDPAGACNPGIVRVRNLTAPPQLLLPPPVAHSYAPTDPLPLACPVARCRRRRRCRHARRPGRSRRVERRPRPTRSPSSATMDMSSTDPAGTLATLKSLGVGVLRLTVHWNAVAPKPKSLTAPTGFAAVAGKPTAYSGHVVGALRRGRPRRQRRRHRRRHADQRRRAAVGAGVRACRPRSATARRGLPSASAYGQFVKAVALRYPTVHFWEIWNEENWGPSLAPQQVGHTLVSAGMYRSMLSAAWTSLQATGHGHDTIVDGSLSPRGEANPGAQLTSRPLDFLRALFCVSSTYKPLTGKTARAAGCPTGSASAFRAANPALFNASGFGIHPYPYNLPPTQADSKDPDFVEFNEIPRLVSALNRLTGAYGSHKRLGGLQHRIRLRDESAEPEHVLRPPALRLPEHRRVLHQLGRVPELARPAARQHGPVSALRPESGVQDPVRKGRLRHRSAVLQRQAEASYAAYRMPLFLPLTTGRRGQSLEVWGCVRPGSHGARPAVRADPVPVGVQGQLADALHGRDPQRAGLLRRARAVPVERFGPSRVAVPAGCGHPRCDDLQPDGRHQAPLAGWARGRWHLLATGRRPCSPRSPCLARGRAAGRRLDRPDRHVPGGSERDDRSRRHARDAAQPRRRRCPGRGVLEERRARRAVASVAAARSTPPIRPPTRRATGSPTTGSCRTRGRTGSPSTSSSAAARRSGPPGRTPRRARPYPEAWMPSARAFGAFARAVGVRYGGRYRPCASCAAAAAGSDVGALERAELRRGARPAGDRRLAGADRAADVPESARRGLGSAPGHRSRSRRDPHRQPLAARPERARHGSVARGAPRQLLDHEAASVHPLPLLRRRRLPPSARCRRPQRRLPDRTEGGRAIPGRAPGAVQGHRLRDPSLPAQPPAHGGRLARPRVRRVQRDSVASRRTLDRLQQVYGSRTRFPIYNTEYGYITDPPNHEGHFVSPATAAYYLNWSEYLSWRNPRVATTMQFLLTDPNPTVNVPEYGGFATGLILYSGRKLPVYNAYRMPIFLPRTTVARGQPVEVWGCVRPAHTAPGPQRVKIQFRRAHERSLADARDRPHPQLTRLLRRTPQAARKRFAAARLAPARRPVVLQPHGGADPPIESPLGGLLVSAFDAHRPPEQSVVADCVHCGFCLDSCPTYVLWAQEADSPRGRIVLIGEGLESTATLSPEMVTHFDRCLGCMACVTACPSGVRYDRLIERVRPQVERHHRRPRVERALRRLLFETLPHPRRLRALAPVIAASRRLGAERLPERLSAPLRIAPRTPLRATRRTGIPVRTAAVGPQRGRGRPAARLRAARVLRRCPPGDGRRARRRGLRGARARGPGLLRGARTARRRGAVRHRPRAGDRRRLRRARSARPHRRQRGRLRRGDARVRRSPRNPGGGGVLRACAGRLGAARLRRRAGPAGAGAVARRLPRRLPPRPRPGHSVRAAGACSPRYPGSSCSRSSGRPTVCCGSAGIYNLVQPQAAAALGARKAANLLDTGAAGDRRGQPRLRRPARPPPPSSSAARCRSTTRSSSSGARSRPGLSCTSRRSRPRTWRRSACA